MDPVFNLLGWLSNLRDQVRMLANKKIIVTGACGFIGSHLVEELVKEGAKVKALVMYNPTNSWGWLEDLPSNILGKIEIVAGDIRDSFSMIELLRGAEIVIHLAALIGIPYSYLAPKSYVDTNIQGTLNLLESARLNKVERFIHTSTSEVYGSAIYVPIDEKHPLQPQSPYSASKMSADHLALSYYNAFGLPVVVARPFNTYGPRQSARAVIPTIISQVLTGKKSIQLGSIAPLRDFTYVKDTVQGFIKLAAANKTIEGSILNFGTGFEVSIEQLTILIRNIIGIDFKITQDETRIRPEKSEVDRLCADNSFAKKTISYHPELIGLKGLETGLQKTVDWMRGFVRSGMFKESAYNL